MKPEEQEPIFNTGPICDDCAEEKRVKWQKDNADIILKRGDNVKIGFTDGDRCEWMWVLLTFVNGNNLIGTLNNDPFVVQGIKFDDEVKFERKEINQLTKD